MRGARTTAQRVACISNLRQIEGAKQTWALENKKPRTAVPTWDDLLPYLGRGARGSILVCPEGGTYQINAVNTPATCSVPGHTLPD